MKLPNRTPLFIKIIIISLLCVTLFLSVFAHSGNTDSNGGHYNRKTGEYHYHSGEYAGRESSGYVPIIAILLSVGTIVGLSLFVWTSISNSLPHKVVFRLKDAFRTYNASNDYTNTCYKNLQDIKEKAVIPDGYVIGKDGLPKEINCTSWRWGKSLTVYTVRDGWKLHLQYGCENSTYEQHIYRFQNKRHSFCKICANNYTPPNFDWYVEYLKLAPCERAYESAKKQQEYNMSKLRACYNDSNKKLTRFFLFFSKENTANLKRLKKQCETIIQLHSK